MSNDSHTVVRQRSWFSRIGDSIKGVVVGFILFVVAFPLLVCNEGRSVRRHKTLQEGAKAVVMVSADAVDASREGELVHVAGRAETEQILTDPEFGVSARAIQLKRRVELYQWTENKQSTTKKKLGGGTETIETYGYTKVWSEHPIDSTLFKEKKGHQNPGAMPYESGHFIAERVTLGAFTLSTSLIRNIDDFKSLPLEDASGIPDRIRSKAKLHDLGLYVGIDPAAPQIGDFRIFFTVVTPTDVSVIAMQVGSTFEPYTAQTGGTIELLQVGTHSAGQMFHRAEVSNTTITWVLRIVGFLVMLFGLALILSPLSVLADVIPIFGDIVGAGTGLMAFLLAALFSSVTIAVGWIAYRPWLAGILFSVAILVMIAIYALLRRARINLRGGERRMPAASAVR